MYMKKRQNGRDDFEEFDFEAESELLIWKAFEISYINFIFVKTDFYFFVWVPL